MREAKPEEQATSQTFTFQVCQVAPGGGEAGQLRGEDTAWTPWASYIGKGARHSSSVDVLAAFSTHIAFLSLSWSPLQATDREGGGVEPTSELTGEVQGSRVYRTQDHAWHPPGHSSSHQILQRKMLLPCSKCGIKEILSHSPKKSKRGSMQPPTLGTGLFPSKPRAHTPRKPNQTHDSPEPHTVLQCASPGGDSIRDPYSRSWQFCL